MIETKRDCKCGHAKVWHLLDGRCTANVTMEGLSLAVRCRCPKYVEKEPATPPKQESEEK